MQPWRKILSIFSKQQVDLYEILELGNISLTIVAETVAAIIRAGGSPCPPPCSHAACRDIRTSERDQRWIRKGARDADLSITRRLLKICACLYMVYCFGGGCCEIFVGRAGHWTAALPMTPSNWPSNIDILKPRDHAGILPLTPP